MIENQTPPFFKHGPSLLARFTAFAVASIILMAIDLRLDSLGVVRGAVAVAITPLQRLATAPAELGRRIGDFFVTQSLLQEENHHLRQQQLLYAAQLQRYQALLAENAYLRKLLDARQRLGETAVLAEILYAGRDPFSHKITVDKGTRHAIEPGQAVVDHLGVVGQVTRVYPFSSEITLLTDKNQAIPVEVVRNGLRAIAFGQGQDEALELAYMPINADIQTGDVLVTSGIDGTYPPGLPVAVVSTIERNAGLTFAKISCTPSAGTGQHRQLLILAGERKPPPAAAESLPPQGVQKTTKGS